MSWQSQDLLESIQETLVPDLSLSDTELAAVLQTVQIFLQKRALQHAQKSVTSISLITGYDRKIKYGCLTWLGRQNELGYTEADRQGASSESNYDLQHRTVQIIYMLNK